MDETIVLGKWPKQPGGQAEPLVWNVLGEAPMGGTLLITKDIIECWPYNEETVAICWKDCDLRLWMNTAFLSWAFNDEERARLVLTTNLNTGSEQFSIEDSPTTKDYVFALSLDEAKTYLTEEATTPIDITDYAAVRGAHNWWWLRSPGFTSFYAATVCHAAWIREGGHFVNLNYVGVRPCVVIRSNE